MISKIYTSADPVLISKWRALWTKSPVANCVNSPDWLLAAIESFTYPDLKILTIWDKDRLQVVAPLVLSYRYGLKIYTSPGGFVCGLPFLIDLENNTLLVKLVQELQKVGNIILEEVPESFASKIKLINQSVITYHSSLNCHADLRPNSISLMVNKYLNKFRRKIVNFDQNFELIYETGDNQDGLESVFKLDCHSTKYDRGYDNFSNVQNRMFYKNLSKYFKKQFTLQFLKHDGKLIAYDLGLTMGHTYYGSQMAHDKNYSTYSPGKILMIKVYNNFSERGIVDYDFGAGDSSFKKEFTNSSTSLNRLLFFKNPTIGLMLKFIDVTKNKYYELLKSHTKIYAFYRHLTHYRPTLKKINSQTVARPRLGVFGKLIPAVFCLLVLLVSLRGQIGAPDMSQLNTRGWKEDGPFELSPERGRFGLIYSLVEDRSVHFSIPVGRFITPDLGIWNGNFVSLFAPGISFITAPGYILGRYFGATQVGAYAVISIFAVLNYLLIRHISKHLGASNSASTLAGLVFVFATPAFAYAVNLYQHHVSTFLILASIALVIRDRVRWLSFFTIWFLCALSLLVDYPNLFIMAPIGLVALFRVITIQQVQGEMVRISTSFRLLLTFLGVIIPLSVFAVFNNYSYGSPTRLSGTVPLVSELDEKGLPVAARNSDLIKLEKLDYSKVEAQSTLNFFNPRNFVNGLYILILSLDRGLLIYAPVVIFGLFGVIRLYQLKQPYLPLLIATGTINLLLYAMWGDPWGGWAFGPRYLIPGFAIMSIFVSIFLTFYHRYLPLLILFLITATYSLGVNTLGAITTSALPPRVQVLELEQITGTIQKYTWERNWDMLVAGHSKSFFYNQYIKGRITPQYFYYSLTGILTLAFIYLLVRSYRDKYATDHSLRQN